MKNTCKVLESFGVFCVIVGVFGPQWKWIVVGGVLLLFSAILKDLEP